MFEGSYVAMLTPMTESGSVDESALRKMVRWQIESGTDGLVPMGTTGEAPTLSKEEHCRVLSIVVEEAGGRIPVIAGCGSNNTAEALDFHRYAHDIGASGALHVTGYYNRPSQEGLFRHFEQLSEQNSLPIVVYNIPPRAIVDISVATMARIASLSSVVGVKDATRDLARPGLERQHIHTSFDQLSGEDATAVAYNAAGGAGCISVTANVAPKHCSKLQSACRNNDYEAAKAIQQQLMPLHEALFLEPSPVGIKYACSKLNLCSDAVRLPLVSLSEETKNRIDGAMLSLGIA